MIKITRSAKPAVLIDKEADWIVALHTASTKREKERASNKYRHPQVQEALKVMFHGKCGYCESRIEHMSDPHIEHYRPKSRFPELTFDWNNLLLACGKCNSIQYKGDKFPEANVWGPIVNPCIDNPDDHFSFVYDVQARLANVVATTGRGKTTEELIGLNRSDLRHHRSVQITRLMALARFADTDTTAQQLLLEAKQNDAEYTTFARNIY